MLDQFAPSDLAHIHREPKGGNAASTVLSPTDFSDAVAEIKNWDGYQPTPLWSLKILAGQLNVADLLYKDEGERFGLGSFKALGGAYAAARTLQTECSKQLGTSVSLADIRAGLHKDLTASITLVSATDGNHGRSLAWGAQRFGAPCRIYIHRDVSEGRAEAMRAFGADVIRIDGDYDDSVRIAREEAEANGWFIISDTSWEGYTEPPRAVMAGYGAMVHEIADQSPEPPTHVFLQGGVGGLAAAVTAGLTQIWGDSAPRVVIVEPDLAACLYESARAGAMRAVQIEEETMMAGLSCGEPSPLAWAILDEEASDFITIPDRMVAPAMRLLARPLESDPSIVAGESAVAGLAAAIAIAQDDALRAAFGFTDQSRLLFIGSEGATDPEIYQEIMAA
ncbi:diaminopropionate ammonia-lyase [Coralliovum pocilloporae]|uniref:diaminopropionate ammonia-lyase n=1 Tax=Coralliovum pocilloporae TaxID=3066369 RepID=UPI00330750B4